MDHFGREEDGNDVCGNLEIRRESQDLPVRLKCNCVLKSPLNMMCASMTGDWGESSTNDLMGRVDTEDKERCLLSFSGSKPPATSWCTEKHSGNAMSELTAGHKMTLKTASHNTMYHDGQGLCQHVLLIASGSRCKNSDGKSMCQCDGRETMLLRNGKQLTKVPQDLWGMKSVFGKKIDPDRRETSSELSYIDEMIHSMPTEDAPSKEFCSSGFFPPLLTRSFKGKGTVRGTREVLPEFCSSEFGEMEKKMNYARNLAFGALIRSSVNSSKHPFFGANRAYLPNSLNCGINLREWLKLGCCTRDRVECLLLFRQVVELVDVAHSQGTALKELRPCYFKLLPSSKVVYTGTYAKSESAVGSTLDFSKKRPLVHDEVAYCSFPSKQQKHGPDQGSFNNHYKLASNGGSRSKALNTIDSYVIGPQEEVDYHPESYSDCHPSEVSRSKRSIYSKGQLEEKWYSSPEQMNGGPSTASSNIYSLGVLLFELFSWFESFEDCPTMMLDLRHRILPPYFLSANPRETGFCLWLLHPDPFSRPTTREILQSELFQSRDTWSAEDSVCSANNEDHESEMLIHFLSSLMEQKQKHASKLVGDIESLEKDIKELKKRYSSRISTIFSPEDEKLYVEIMEEGSSLDLDPTATPRPYLDSCMRLMRNYKQIEEAYFMKRTQRQNSSLLTLSNKESPKDQDRLSVVNNNSEKLHINQKSIDPFGSFYEDLCKFVRYDQFKVCGSLQIRDLLNSANVVGSLSLDRDEDYIATAGVSKKIKVFEFDAILNDSTDIHYPVADMSNNSKLSCICWNHYMKNYLASTDYAGIVKVWDVGTGQEFSQYVEHQRRAWSVDFSVADPMMFATGSDDCSLRLWTVNERNSISTIWNPANICCVQFSTFSSHFLIFGSADYKIYCYDLRQTKNPWSTLAGHKKTVSYVKFLDPMTLVSASTDSTLKLWDLSKTTTGLCADACYLTLSGHTNEKNFVGLSVLDGYVACGSETNEVYCYYKSLPVPITSYKFPCMDPLSGKEIEDDTGHFVSSVCWRQKSNMVVAANSSGNMRVLQMV